MFAFGFWFINKNLQRHLNKNSVIIFSFRFCVFKGFINSVTQCNCNIYGLGNHTWKISNCDTPTQAALCMVWALPQCPGSTYRHSHSYKTGLNRLHCSVHEFQLEKRFTASSETQTSFTLQKSLHRH